MKNILAILLSMVLLFSVPACREEVHAIDDDSTLAAADSAQEEQPAVLPEGDAGTSDTPSNPSPDAETSHPSDGTATEPAEPPVPETVPEEAVPARSIDPEKPMVALTFDDGPHPTRTDALLDILEENGAVATFFQVGQNLYKDPDAVRRAEAMGCEIGSHSYRHANLSKLSAEEIAADLKKADDAFIEVLGHAPTLLRPPYGAMNSAVKTTTGRSIVTWSIDTEDWLSRDAEKVIASVQGAGNLDGQVILMHDVHASTIEAAKTLIPWLIDQGYQLVTVTELITLHYGDQILPNGVYGYSYFKFGKPVILPEGQTAPQPEEAAPVPSEPSQQPEETEEETKPASGGTEPVLPEGVKLL